MAPADRQVVQKWPSLPPPSFPLHVLPACALGLPGAPVGITFPAAVLEARGPWAPRGLAAAAAPVLPFLPAPPSSGEAASRALDEPCTPFI